MKALSYAFVFIVPVLNIALNANLQIAASTSSSLGDAFSSGSFMTAFAVGIASFVSLLVFYRSGIGLAPGILWMGAISILGGTIYGIKYHGNTLTITEYVLLGAIAVLFIFRLSRAYCKLFSS